MSRRFNNKGGWKRRSWRKKGRSPVAAPYRATFPSSCIVRVVGPLRRLRENGAKVTNWDVFVADPAVDASLPVGKCYQCHSLTRAARLGADISLSKNLPLRNEATSLKNSPVKDSLIPLTRDYSSFAPPAPRRVDAEIEAVISALEDEWKCACS